MKNLRPLLLGLFAFTLIFSSCKKEQGCTNIDATNYSSTAEEDDGSCKYTIRGCTDVNSTNYNSEATVSDGTCKYEGSIVFWYSEATATDLVNIGSSSLTYYLNGNIIGSSATTIFFTGAPDCGAVGSVGVTGELADKTESVSFSVVDDLGDELWAGSVTLTANTCFALELN